MAAWLLVVSSIVPLRGTITFTSTTGNALPPPIWPACEKSMIRSPCGFKERYFSCPYVSGYIQPLKLPLFPIHGSHIAPSAEPGVETDGVPVPPPHDRRPVTSNSLSSKDIICLQCMLPLDGCGRTCGAAV